MGQLMLEEDDSNMDIDYSNRHRRTNDFALRVRPSAISACESSEVESEESSEAESDGSHDYLGSYVISPLYYDPYSVHEYGNDQSSDEDDEEEDDDDGEDDLSARGYPFHDDDEEDEDDQDEESTEDESESESDNEDDSAFNDAVNVVYQRQNRLVVEPLYGWMNTAEENTNDSDCDKDLNELSRELINLRARRSFDKYLNHLQAVQSSSGIL